MTSSSTCKGITIKGQRCRIQVNGEFCRHHKDQRSSGGQTYISPSAADQQKGFIYIYTLRELLNNSPKKSWSLHVQNLPGTKSKHRDQWRNFNATKSPYMLLKIGMTSKRVEDRLKQWEASCHHELQCLHPAASIDVHESTIDRIVRRFASLGSKTAKDTHFQTYLSANKGFFCQRSLREVELEIHRLLRQKYGRGEMYCSGCKQKTMEALPQKSIQSNSTSIPFETYNIHREWFLIPKDDLKEVFKLIDYVSYSLGRNR